MPFDAKVMRRKLDSWVDSRRDDIVADLARLIAVKSVRGEPEPGKPYGAQPAAALETASEILRRLGFKPTNFENRVVTADLNASEPCLGILCHLDVVPAGDGWQTDPFKADVRGGCVYGRGAIDNKGPAVAAMYALAAAREIAQGLIGGCRLMLGSAEETGHDDLKRYMARHQMPPNVFTPDSCYPVVNAEKGRLVVSFSAGFAERGGAVSVVELRAGSAPNVVPDFAEAVIEGLGADLAARAARSFPPWKARFEVFGEGSVLKVVARGDAAHAMEPEKGENALTAMLGLLAKLPLGETESARAIRALSRLFPHGDTSGSAIGVEMSDSVSGALTANLGALALDPSGVSGAVDIRYPVCATEETLDRRLARAFEAAGFKTCITEKTPFHHTPEESRLVRTLIEVYEEYTGEPGRCLAVGGQTYVHGVSGGVAFGPAMPGVNYRLHGPDEFIRVSDLLLAAKMYSSAIIKMCSGDSAH